MLIKVINVISKFKCILLSMFLIFTVLGLLSCVSAASLTVDEAGYGSTAVVSQTQSNGYKIPGYVKVNGKNSTSPSFLNTLTKTVVQVNQNVKTPVTISSVKAAPNPSGSATGNLTKSQYITIANNVKSFISSNGRAPNYATSSKGNIRYESLVYFYAKVMRYYKINGKLPSTMNVLNIPGTTGGVNIQDSTKPTVTANLATGVYNSNKVVTLTATDNVDSNPSIYYTTNGNTPTTSTTKYTSPITISTTTTLKFIARDIAGNVAAVQTRTYTIDKTPPTVTASPGSGVYNTTKSVILTAKDNLDTNPTIYYTTNGKNPTTSSTKYTVPITISTTTTLKFMARDRAGNTSPVQSRTYTIDKTPPTVTANPQSGVCNTTKKVTLTAIDNIDSNPTIYFTTNGSYPTTSSTKYTAPITISNTTTLKFIARDSAGNQSPIQTAYYLFSPVGNINTGKGYTSIQAAVNDSLTLNGHTIEILGGTYTENVVVNKKLNIKPAVSTGTVTVRAANSSSPIFTVNSGGSGSSIIGLTAIGATGSEGIYINYASNCKVNSNIIQNNYHGILVSNSSGNSITSNVISNNYDGISCESSDNNVLSRNSVSNNEYGLFFMESQNGQILENIITNNKNGIYLYDFSGEIHFNQISNNQFHGLHSVLNTDINAANNWWGTNNPVVSSSSPSDIYIVGGSVKYNPWLVLKVDPTYYKLSGDKVYESIITAYLTCNSNGEDTSLEGHVPDGIPVNFNTNLGAITSVVYTKNGKAESVLNLNGVQSGTATVSAIINRQTVSTSIDKILKATIKIYGTAVDLQTLQQLNLMQKINLSSPVTWISVVYGEAGEPGADYLKILVNGNVILTKYFFNYRDVPNDDIRIILSYPGGSITKTEKIIYRNDLSTDFECIQSFAIATTKITDTTLKSWLNKKSQYPVGYMKAAYGTFMSTLTTLWINDKIADEISKNLNGTWSRTTPTVVMSGVNDNGKAYIHCQDPLMGMKFIGDGQNVKVFRLVCSLMISEAEHMALGSAGNSVSSTLSIIASGILEGKSYELIFNEDNTAIFTLEEDQRFKIVIDLETGLVKEIIDTDNFQYKGAETVATGYCYHNQLTEDVNKRTKAFLDAFGWDGVESTGGGLLITAGLIAFGACPPLGALMVIGGLVLTADASGLTEDPLNPYNWLDFGVSTGLSLAGPGGVTLKTAIQPAFRQGMKLTVKKYGYKTVVHGTLGSNERSAIKTYYNNYITGSSISGLINMYRPEKN